MSILFNITHETGDLTEYTSTVTDGGDLSVATAAALANSNYGLQCVIDDSTAIYGSKSFAGGNIFRYRYYFDPNTLPMGDSDGFVTTSFTSGTTWIAATYLVKSTAVWQVALRLYKDDATSVWATTTYTIADEPCYIEVLVWRADDNASANGGGTIWVNGVQKGTRADIDNYDNFAGTYSLRAGAIAAIDAGTSGTFYIDEIRANDDGEEIGPFGNPWHAYAQQ